MLYSGKFIKCHSVSFQSSFIVTDSAKFIEDEVEFFRNEKGLYANTRLYSLFKKTSSFIKAETTGKINLFTEIKENYTTGQHGTSISYSTTYYYNKEFGDLKYFQIKFLEQDLADNNDCLTKLEKIRKKRFMQYEKYYEEIEQVVFLYNYLSSIESDNP